MTNIYIVEFDNRFWSESYVNRKERRYYYRQLPGKLSELGIFYHNTTFSIVLHDPQNK